MENKEFLNEETYQKSNAKVKKGGKIIIIVGTVMLIIGIILCIIGFLGFGNEVASSLQTDVNPKGIFSSFGMLAVGGFLSTSGGFILFVGLMIRFLIGNKREITAYSVQQTMPIAKEGIEKMAPSVGVAAKEIAKGIKEVIKEADSAK